MPRIGRPPHYHKLNIIKNAHCRVTPIRQAFINVIVDFSFAVYIVIIVY